MQMVKALLLWLTLLSALPARADNVQDAKSHYKHGTAAYALGKFGEAATEYEAAYELAPDSALLYNAAQAHRLAGNKERALMLYQSYVRLYGTEISNRDEVENRIVELKKAIASAAKTKREAPAPQAQPASPAIVAPPSNAVATAPPPRKRSLVRSPGLWIGIGAGVVVVAGVAIGLGLALGKGDPMATIGKVTY